MSLDDQLYKDDGTWITRVDIFLMKVAETIARHLVDEEDENFDRALRTFLRLAAIIMIAGVFLEALIPGITRFLALVYLGASIGLLILSQTARCNLRGSTVDHSEKLFSLTALMGTMLYMPFSYLVVGEFAGPVIAAANLLFSIAFLVFVLAMMYVIRLGTPPPRRKKAKVWKPATHH